MGKRPDPHRADPGAGSSEPIPPSHNSRDDASASGEIDSSPGPLLRQLEDHAPVGIITLDRQLRYTFWNRKMAEFTGLSPKEVLGKRPQGVFPFLRETDFLEGVEGALEGRTVTTRDHRYQIPGTHRRGWAVDTFSPLRDDSGETVGVLIMVRDITERKEAEEALRMARDRAQLYLDTVQVAMVALDCQGRVEMINQRGAEILGCPPGELEGEDWFEVAIPARVRSEVRGVFERVVRGEVEKVEHYENTVLAADGTERRVSWQNVPVRDSEGEIVGTLSAGEDITGLRRAEEARDASQVRYRSLYEAVQVGVLLQAKSGEIMHANAPAREIFGMSESRIMGKTSEDQVWRMVDEEEHPVAGRDHPSMITFRTGEPIRGAIRGLFTGDPARMKWLLINTEPILFDDSDEVHEVVITFQDITPLKQAQDELEAERNRAQRYLDTAEVMLVALDSQGRVEMINRKGAEILGFREEELLGRSWFEVALPVHVRAKVQEVFRRLMDGELEQAQYSENVVITSEGKERILAWHNALIQGPGGEIQGTLSSGEDITARRRAEEALARSEARFRELFEEAPLAYQSLDPEGRCLQINQAFTESFGYEMQDLKDRSFPSILTPRSQELFSVRYPAFKQSGGVTGWELELVRKDGEVRLVSINGRTRKSRSGEFLRSHCILMDITDQRRAEESLERARVDLKRSEQRLRALSSRLAAVREEERKAVARDLHDVVGQALTSLRMDLASRRSELLESDQEAAGELSPLIARTDQMVEFVRDLSSRLRPPILDVMGLGPAMEWQVDEHRGRVDVRFHLDLPEDGPAVGEDTGIGLFRVFQEALTNVLRHAHAEEAWIRLKEEDGILTLTVEDDGSGIPQADIEARSSLGIVGMRERVLELGGDLTVERRGPGGTVVKVELPLEQAAESREHT